MKSSRSKLAVAICAALAAGSSHGETIVVDSIADSGPDTLRAALAQANGNTEADVVDLTPIAGQTISLSSGELLIASDQVTIQGAGVTIDAGGTSRALQVYNSDVELNDLTLTGGDEALSGGGLLIGYSSVSLDNVEITGNATERDGGGINALFSELEISDSVISGNTAGDDGGGISVYSDDDAALAVAGATISNNSAGDIGGGLNINSANGYFGLLLEQSTITGNTAAAFGGGAVYVVDYGRIGISNVEVSDNTVSSSVGGLGIYQLDGDDITIADSVVTGNTAGGVDPAASRSAGSWTERPAAIWGQGVRGEDPGSLGGLYLVSLYSDIDVSRTTISGNRSAQNIGGILALASYGTVRLTQSTIAGNSAGQSFGGALLDSETENVLVSNSTVSGNRAGGDVGGMAAFARNLDGMTRGDRAPAVIEFSTITANVAAGSVGGVGFVTGDPALIVGSVIGSNEADAATVDVAFGAGTNSANVDYSLVRVDPASGTLDRDSASAALAGLDPLLAPLADNGGPTRTHLPYEGSPLIDAVPSASAGCGTAVVADQRGEPRPEGAGCDVGSVEGVGPPPPEIVPVPVLDRLGLWLMAGLLGLAGLWTSARQAAWRRSS